MSEASGETVLTIIKLKESIIIVFKSGAYFVCDSDGDNNIVSEFYHAS